MHSNEKPLVLHIINDLATGGAEILLKNTIELLDEFQHVVVCLFSKTQEDDFSLKGIHVIYLNHKGWKNLPVSVIKLRAIILNLKPILLHAHLFHSTVCARLATPVSVPFVFTLHSVYSEDAFKKNVGSLLAAKFTLKKRHNLVAVSNFVLTDYLDHVTFSGKRFVLYNFLPDSFFQKRNEVLLTGTVKFVAVGNLKEAKNYHYLLEIFEYLKGMNVSLDIYGTGPLSKELSAYIQQRNLDVHLCGTTNDVTSIFQHYNFFIQASSHEGFGLSVIEAMATGIPVILSDIPVFREITNNMATFFPLGNPRKAAEILIEAFKNKELPVLADQAFKYVQINYSAKSYRQKLLAIYEEVTQKSLLNGFEA